MFPDAAFEVKNRVSVREALLKYGVAVNRAGFAVCPFHGDTKPSLKLYGEDRFYCFGCGESGDVITLVRKLFGLSFRDALRKLDSDFSLGLSGSLTPQAELYAEKQAFLRKREMRRRKEERKALYDSYAAALDEFSRLDRNKMRYAPKSPAEAPHPLYLEAVEKLPYCEYLLELAENGLRKS